MANLIFPKANETRVRSEKKNSRELVPGQGRGLRSHVEHGQPGVADGHQPRGRQPEFLQVEADLQSESFRKRVFFY